MSSKSTDSETSHSSDYSEGSFSSEYEKEVEVGSGDESEHDVDEDAKYSALSTSSDEETFLCADDPVADDEWTARYEEEMQELREQEERLNDRLDGTVNIGEWCNCGNCGLEFLQNISECYCCKELDGCCEAMQSEIALQDLPQGSTIKCIVDHPGFNPVCLQKWSLRMAAWQYKTKGKKRYKQTGSEDRFLRSISYREFSRLVYGVLGNRRVPLPACAYTAIRKQFPVEKDDAYKGFEIDEED